MLIQIEEPVNEIVRFSTAIGPGYGLWAGRMKPLPQQYHIEFTITVPVVLNQNASTVPSTEMFIRFKDGMNEIQGLVEAKDDDGVIYLRLAPDCLIMIDNVEKAVRPGEYLLMKIHPMDLEIYPF